MSRRYDNSLEGPDDTWLDDRQCACIFLDEDDEEEKDDDDGD